VHDRSTDFRLLLFTCAACIAALWWRRARADEPPPPSYSSTVRSLGPQTVVTSIDATQPSTRLVSVADLIEGQAGVFVRARGGLGSFTSVSIRGSEANEVAILVDGMPLSRAAAGVIDLAQLSVAGLQRVEIWRGVPPIEFGAEAVGGAINLVTRRGALVPELRASVGGGSFGARSASMGWSGSDRGLRIDLSAAYNGATGDFRYYDTAGTLFNQTDDRISTRHNNDFNQGAVDATIAGRRWRLGVHGFLKDQGTPGVGLLGAESLHARLTTGRALVDGGVDGSAGPFVWRAAAQVLYERNAFANPFGEQVGPFGANVSDADALSVGLHARARAPWGRRQHWLVLADLRSENRFPHDLLLPALSGAASQRLLGAIGVEDEVRVLGDRLTLTAGVRLDGTYSRLTLPQATGALAPSTDVAPTGRITARAELTRWLALRGAVGRFVRFPTLLELFGDGAFVLPRALLKPETAWAGDVGATVAGGGPRVRGSLEATFFGRAVADTIVYLPGGRAAAPANIGDSRMLGVELRAQAAVGEWLAARVDYTFVDARQVPGDGQIPGRPQNELSLRVDVRRLPFAIFYEMQYVDRLYRDPANSAFVPERALHGIGVSFDYRWFSALVEVRNLADLRVVELPAGTATVPYPLVDYFSYPLPGRAVYATLVLRK
jgi:vitamin B12 transporter